MEVIPAIDLMKGNVVRLSQGNPATASVYTGFGNPVEVATKWKHEGARTLHIIDLDAAFNVGQNLQVVTEIAEAVNLPIHFGGGIRKSDTAEKILNVGIERVILGTLAFKELDTVLRIQRRFGSDRLIIALDNWNGRVKEEGWKSFTGMTVPEALKKFSELGMERFLVTSINKDGMLKGPDLKTLSNISHLSNACIIAAGGVGSLKDIANLRKTGVAGTVVGKALYERKLTLRDAMLVGEGEVC